MDLGRRLFSVMPIAIAMTNTLSAISDMTAIVTSRNFKGLDDVIHNVLDDMKCIACFGNYTAPTKANFHHYEYGEYRWNGTASIYTPVVPNPCRIYGATSCLDDNHEDQRPLGVKVQCAYDANGLNLSMKTLWILIWSSLILTQWIRSVKYGTNDLRFYIAMERVKTWRWSKGCFLLIALFTFTTFVTYVSTGAERVASGDISEFSQTTLVDTALAFAALNIFIAFPFVNPTIVNIKHLKMSEDFPDTIALNFESLSTIGNLWTLLLTERIVIHELLEAIKYDSLHNEDTLSRFGDTKQIKYAIDKLLQRHEDKEEEEEEEKNTVIKQIKYVIDKLLQGHEDKEEEEEKNTVTEQDKVGGQDIDKDKERTGNFEKSESEKKEDDENGDYAWVVDLWWQVRRYLIPVVALTFPVILAISTCTSKIESYISVYNTKAFDYVPSSVGNEEVEFPDDAVVGIAAFNETLSRYNQAPHVLYLTEPADYIGCRYGFDAVTKQCPYEKYSDGYGIKRIVTGFWLTTWVLYAPYVLYQGVLYRADDFRFYLHSEKVKTTRVSKAFFVITLFTTFLSTVILTAVTIDEGGNKVAQRNLLNEIFSFAAINVMLAYSMVNPLYKGLRDVDIKELFPEEIAFHYDSPLFKGTSAELKITNLFGLLLKPTQILHEVGVIIALDDLENTNNLSCVGDAESLRSCMAVTQSKVDSEEDKDEKKLTERDRETEIVYTENPMRRDIEEDKDKIKKKLTERDEDVKDTVDRETELVRTENPLQRGLQEV